MRLTYVVVSTALLVLAACGSSGPKPEARVASSEGAIRGAEEVGAKADPRASLHLKLAQEQRDKAMALIKEGDNKAADLMLQRAEADAELAVALARESAAKADADKTMESIQQLKKKADQ